MNVLATDLRGVIANLLEKTGYHVYEPIMDNAPFDILAVKDGKVLQIKVVTSQLSDGPAIQR